MLLLALIALALWIAISIPVALLFAGMATLNAEEEEPPPRPARPRREASIPVLLGAAEIAEHRVLGHADQA